MYETMTINKSQISRPCFGLSIRSLILDSHQYIKTYFSWEPFGQLNLTFVYRLLNVGEQKIIKLVSSHDQDVRHAHIL